MLGLLGAVAAATGAAQTVSSESRQIATIDFYGQRTVSEDALRKALPIHEGDKVSKGDSLTEQARSALNTMAHVRDVRVELICCAQDAGMHLFVGVQEEGSPELHFQPAQSGTLRLPEELVAADAAVTTAIMDAVLKGHAAEDDSEGHALLKDVPAARALQEKLIPLAAKNLDILRKVLHGSASGDQRAIAAQFLGYAPDQQAVVADLVQAITDSDEEVRNNAMRALLVFTMAKKPPQVPYSPFVDLLTSPVWTDHNKSSFALMTLTAHRDPQLLSMLRQRALPQLEAMARWHDRDHSLPAYVILGCIGGLSDAQIQEHWNRGDAGAVIAAALKASGQNERTGGPKSG